MERYCPYCMHLIQPGKPCPNCKRDPETYRPESRQLPPGTLLQERYVLGRALGAGGFGITYLGWDLKLERRVAVRSISPPRFSSGNVSDPGCDLLYCLWPGGLHKGQGAVPSRGQDHGRFGKDPPDGAGAGLFPGAQHRLHYYGVSGGSNSEEITQAQGPCSAQVLLPLLEPVIRAMEAMHQANIIHRDISPDNLMLLSNGTMKLMDFGCAGTSRARPP